MMAPRAWWQSGLTYTEGLCASSANLSTCTLTALEKKLDSFGQHSSAGNLTTHIMHPKRLLDSPNFPLTGMRRCQLKIHFWYKPDRTCLPSRENGNLFCRLRAKDHFYCSLPEKNIACNTEKTYLRFVHKADLILFGAFGHYNNEIRTSSGY